MADNSLAVPSVEALAKASDNIFIPQNVSVTLCKDEIQYIQGNAFISASAYCRIAQAAAVSFRVVGEVEKHYDAAGRLQRVSMRMEGGWRNPAGEIQVATQEMEIRAAEVLEELRAKKARDLNIDGQPVYGPDGDLQRIEYRLPLADEQKLYEESLRARMFMDRKLQTRLQARITAALTGITAKSLPAANAKGERTLMVTRMLPAGLKAGQRADLYAPAIAEPKEIVIEAQPAPAPSQKPSERRAAEQEPSQPDAQDAGPAVDPNDRTRCHDCTNVLSDKSYQYFQDHPNYTPRCYKCNEARRAREARG